MPARDAHTNITAIKYRAPQLQKHSLPLTPVQTKTPDSPHCAGCPQDSDVTSDAIANRVQQTTIRHMQVQHSVLQLVNHMVNVTHKLPRQEKKPQLVDLSCWKLHIGMHSMFKRWHYELSVLAQPQSSHLPFLSPSRPLLSPAVLLAPCTWHEPSHPASC